MYNPALSLCFDTNPATLSEYLSYETTYETQNKPDTCRKDETPVAFGTFEEAVGIATSERIETERTAADGVSGANTGTATGAAIYTVTGMEANKTGLQLTLF